MEDTVIISYRASFQPWSCFNLFFNLLNWHLSPDLSSEGLTIQSVPGLFTWSLRASQVSILIRKSLSPPENLLLFPCVQSQKGPTIQPVTHARKLGVILGLFSFKFPISTQSLNPLWHLSIASLPLCAMAHVQCGTPQVPWDTATSHVSSLCLPSVSLIPTPAGFHLTHFPKTALIKSSSALHNTEFNNSRCSSSLIPWLLSTQRTSLCLEIPSSLSLQDTSFAWFLS